MTVPFEAEDVLPGAMPQGWPYVDRIRTIPLGPHRHEVETARGCERVGAQKLVPDQELIQHIRFDDDARKPSHYWIALGACREFFRRIG